MRFRGRGVGTWLTAALSLALLACSADAEKARGQLMLALQTDMQLPKDVSSVRILVLVNGAPRFDRTYPVGPEGAKIPATLAIVAGDDPSTPVEIKVLAFRDSEVRTLNRTITTIPESRIALLRVPIEWLCEGFVQDTSDDDEYASSCEPDGETERACSAGECRDVVVDSKQLPSFKPAHVFGGGTADGGGRCFPVQRCFDDGFAVTPNAACRVELETDADAPLNFALIPASGDGACSDETDNCYVPLDRSTLGWEELDSPAAGRRVFALPPAVCARLDDGSVLRVRGTTACDTKTLATPPCGPGSSVDEPLEPGEEFPVTPVGEGGEGGGGAGGAPPVGGEGGVPAVSGGAGGAPSDAGAGGVPSDAGAGGEGNAGGAGPELPCDPNPCANGTCTDEGGVATCTCFDGFHGDLCETAIPSLTGTGFLESGAMSQAFSTSAAGDIVVGEATTSTGQLAAFVWTANSGPTRLPDLSTVPGSSPLAISADGSTVVGSSFLDNGVAVAVKWELVGSQAATSGEVTVPVGGTVMVMGPTELGSVDPYTDSVARDVSADGSVIVGDVGIESGGPEPFIWTEAGMVSLGFAGSAVAVSDDGTTVACNDQVSGALFWTETSGVQGLGPLNEYTPTATDISGDGTTIVGTTAAEHFRWSLADGVESGNVQLGESSLSDVSSNHDASVLAGTLDSGQAVVWDETHGWRYLVDALTSAGIDTQGWNLASATGLSSDGSLIVGFGEDQAMANQGFVVRLPLTVNLRECVDPEPCLGGATCSERSAGYVCDCAAGYLGRNCGMLEVSPLPDGSDPIVNALSADGSAFVGTSYDNTGSYRPVLWTSPSAPEDLGLLSGAFYGTAYDLSADGSVVVGESGGQAFRWTRSTDMVALGFLPGATSQYSYATAVSADGLVLTGYGTNLNGDIEAFRWTEGSTSLTPLGTLPNMTSSQANAVNADGSVIVGTSGISGTSQAFRWTQAGMVELPMPQATTWASAYGVNADGSVAVGSFQADPKLGGSLAFRWSAAEGSVTIGPLAGANSLEATTVSADGSVVLGRAYTSTRIEAFVWTANRGVVYLRDILLAAGIDPAGLHLEATRALSSDGTRIAGSATDTFTNRRFAWIADLPP
jgi:probable HAF family extracellular repeat protein